MAESIVLLHGFAGTRNAWARVSSSLDPQRYRPVARDLRGHGDARALRPIGFDECCGDVSRASPARFVLCGYSMGGRIALHFALAHRERVARLILVSTTAGIADAAARAQRRGADEILAAQIEGAPIERFVERWRAQPLFAGDPGWVRDLAAEDQRRNDPRALAVALRGLGTGSMTPLWGRLHELDMPVDVVVGERDHKFRGLGERLVAGLGRAQLTVIAGAGHALAVEAPGELAGVIERRQ